MEFCGGFLGLLYVGIFFILIFAIGGSLLVLGLAGGGLLLIIFGLAALSRGEVGSGVAYILGGTLMSSIGFGAIRKR